MENDNNQVQNNTSQPAIKSIRPENIINPMKATTAPQMPTLLEFAEQQPRNTATDDESEK